MTESVLVRREGDVAVITLNRPDKLNAWTAAMRAIVLSHLTAANQDEAIKAVVLTGSGNAFCAGQDLAETAAINPADSAASDTWVQGFDDLYRAVRDLDKPVVAAVNGVAAGSGFQYALTADLRVGHATVRMGQPEILSGIPSITGIWAMWDVLGRSKTTEFALTGQLVDGIEAQRLGLINRLVEPAEVLPSSVRLAAELGALPRRAMRLTKGRLRDLEEAAFADAFAAAKMIHGDAYASGEPQQQMHRFLKRSVSAKANE